MVLVSIRDYRENVLDITQQEAAERLGMNVDTLRKYEKNPTKMTFEMYRHVASEYGFSCPIFLFNVVS